MPKTVKYVFNIKCHLMSSCQGLIGVTAANYDWFVTEIDGASDRLVY